MRLYRLPLPARLFYPRALSRVRTKRKELYLTFDDGPDPVITPLVVGILARKNVRAVFFCNGERAEKYPDLVELIRMKGHLVGNHGYKHLDGWITSKTDYLANVSKAAALTSEVIFRPPHGRITPPQFRSIARQYRIVLWDLMPYDFDRGLTPVKILTILRDKIRSGSIIVFHDREGSSVLSFLEKFITEAEGNGYSFLPLSISGQE